VLRVESADAEGGWHSLFSDSPQLPERRAKLLDAAHTVISFTAGQKDQLADGVSRVAPHAKLVSLDTKQPFEGHVTESLAAQLGESWPALASAAQQMLRSVASRGVGASLTPEDRIVVHPGAGKEANRWPAEQFLRLVELLRDSGDSARVLLGDAEAERWPASLIGQFEQMAEVHRPQTLLHLLDEIASARAFIGNDSGPGHLAGILGVPTVAVFGPSDPVRWRPLGPRIAVIQSDPIAAIPPQAVYTEVSRLLGG
jgi:ADP-heptose:LPS heptosyltransferase